MKNKIFVISFLVVFLPAVVSEKSISPFMINDEYGIIDNKLNVIKKPEFFRYWHLGDVLCVGKAGLKRKMYFFYNKYGKIQKKTQAISVKQIDKSIVIIDLYPKSFFGSREFCYYDVKRKKEYKDNPVKLKTHVVSRDFSNYDVLNKKGKFIKYGLYDCGYWYSEGLLPIKEKNGKTGFINEKGDYVFECPIYYEIDIYDPKLHPHFVFEYSKGIVCVQTEKNVYKIYNKKGKELLCLKDIEVISHTFSSGFLVVKNINDNNYYYINEKGENVFNKYFEEAYSFVNNFAIVKYQGQDAVVDKKGNIYYCKDFCK